MISKYLWKTIVPYLLLAWIVLTVILFLQQSSSRFAEILFGALIGWRAIVELSAAMIVTVTALTAPLAILFGVVVGLGQLRGDSETIAMFAAGFRPRRVVAACLLVGALVSLIAFAINLRGVPFAARTIRRVTLDAALARLESPIEPGVFSVEFKNYVIYVRAGNKESGVWEKVFIYAPENNQIKLITARSGRIDQSSDRSELVLSDAVVTTLPDEIERKVVTLEKVNGLRITLDTGREQLKQRLQSAEKTFDEMGLDELTFAAAAANPKQRAEIEILQNRRWALSLAPLCLAFFGAAVSLRLGRGGKGSAAVQALLIAVLYYLLIVAGEQSARADLIPIRVGAWLPTVLIVLAGFWLLAGKNSGGATRRVIEFAAQFAARRAKPWQRRSDAAAARRFKYIGLLEVELLKSVLKYFGLLGAGLLAIFLIFTAFEVLRAVAAVPNGAQLLAQYLLLLAPFVFLQIAPSVLMISVLIVYTIKARQSETIVWSAAGQSVYALLFPAILTAALIGFVCWELQENVLPATNPKQDALRARLRGSGATAQKQNRFWLAANDGILSYIGSSASDNVNVKDAFFYKLDAEQIHLTEMTKAEVASWQNYKIVFNRGKTIVWKNGGLEALDFQTARIESEFANNPFERIERASDQNAANLRKTIETVESSKEKQRLEIALQQKYAALFLPLVTVIFSAPLVLSLRRQSLTAAIARAVAVWLIFTGVIAFFLRVGSSDGLPPAVAVWAPLVFFSSLGLIFLARTKT